MNINEKQNNETNLKRLAAQRQLYEEARKFSNFQLIYYTIIIIIISILLAKMNSIYIPYIILVSIILVLVDKNLFNHIISKKKKLAAEIQEEFDCDVLNIQWRDNKNKDRPSTTLINEYSLKYIKKNNNYDQLKNWYPATAKFKNSPFEKIICQKTNCWWDGKLRSTYTIFLISTIIFILIVLMIFLINSNMGFKDILISILSPIIPSANYLGSIIISNYKSQCNLNKQKEKISSIVNDLRQNKYSERKLNRDSRELQDIIFESRLNNIMIPNWLYKITKSNNEEFSYIDNEELVNIITDFEKKRKKG